MIIFDTSFIISLLNRRDVHHHKAIEILSTTGEDEGIATHSLVVQETITVIARKAREQSLDCRTWLGKIEEFFENLKILEFTPHIHEVLEVIHESQCQLSYIHCVLVLANRHLSARILTFDNALQRMCEG